MAEHRYRSVLRRWRAGIVLTLALHGGVLLALVVRLDRVDRSPAPSSFAIEMVSAPPSASPQPDRPQEAPQPQRAPTPPVAPMPAVDLRHRTPDGLPPPLRQVPPATPEPSAAPAPPAPPPAAAAAIAESERAATTGSDRDARMTWESEVLARLEAGKRYPASARFARQEATVVVQFVVDRAGRVRQSRLVRPGNVADLDAEALALLRRVRLPPPPATLPTDALQLTVPIEFAIDKGR